jgi:hypothetical protein
MSLDRVPRGQHLYLVSRLMRFARPLLLTLMTFGTLSTSADAGTINVLGSVDYGLGDSGFLPGATVSLTGDRGFTFGGFVLASLLDLGLPSPTPAVQCGVGCSPGSTISLNAAAINTDIAGHATLDGVSYSVIGLGGPSLQLFFSGQVVAPPFGSSTTAVLTVPVSFGGEFDVLPFQPFTNDLVAAAQATLTLQETDSFGAPAWLYEGIRYDLVTPEPATLLLVGTSLTALGLARWRRRRQNWP